MIKVLVYDSGEQDLAKTQRVLSISSAGHGAHDTCVAVSTFIQNTAGYLWNIAQVNREYMVVKQLIGIEDGTFAIDVAVGNRSNTRLHHTITAIIEMLIYGLRNLGCCDEHAPHMDCEFMIDLESCVSHEDCIDCIHEWRRENGVDMERMHPPNPN